VTTPEAIATGIIHQAMIATALTEDLITATLVDLTPARVQAQALVHPAEAAVAATMVETVVVVTAVAVTATAVAAHQEEVQDNGIYTFG
jgi:hypothetical protein